MGMEGWSRVGKWGGRDGGGGGKWEGREAGG